VAWQVVSTKYFSTAGIALQSGRSFDERDRAGVPLVAVINDAMARTLFAGESPIGRRLRAGNATGNELATIIGVVRGVRHDSLNTPPVPELYVPLEQRMVGAMSVVARTVGDPVATAPAVRNAIWDVRRDVAVSDMRSMDALLSASIGRSRLILATLGFFAIAGLLLGTVGIYGVVAYGVQQRLRELGIRAALGADARALRSLVVRHGVRFAAVGVLIGAPLALALSRLLRGLIFGISPLDPLSFASVPAVLIAVAAAASWIPARRASRAEPISVLRSD
jgi:predicted permease